MTDHPEPYFFHGVVLPERAQLSVILPLDFTTAKDNIAHQAKISIVNNQVAVWLHTPYNWNIFDLRNVVKNIVQDTLAHIGYLRGFAYDLEITRVTCLSREIDYVFGIDIPCLTDRGRDRDMTPDLIELQRKSFGPLGVFLRRCFADLVSAMKHPEDTGFYCYRAIESLRHHCAHANDASHDSKTKQWQLFRAISGVSESEIMALKTAADPLRHGEPAEVTGEMRATMFTLTWKIVDSYLQTVSMEIQRSQDAATASLAPSARD